MIMDHSYPHSLSYPPPKNEATPNPQANKQAGVVEAKAWEPGKCTTFVDLSVYWFTAYY